RISPVRNPALPFLGVHFTPTITGRLEAGPNAVLAWKREGYSFTSFSGRDLLEALNYGGFWRMATHQWRNGANEIARSLSKRLFLRSLQRLVPAITAQDIVRGRSGVRAQAIDRTGRLVDD